MYKMEFEDGNFEYTFCEDVSDMLNEAEEYLEEHGNLLNIIEENEEGEEIRTIL